MAAAVQVSAEYRVTAFPPPPVLGAGAPPEAGGANDPGPPSKTTVFDGPEPDDPHFRPFINVRWREVQDNLDCGPRGCGHMLVCRLFSAPLPEASQAAAASGVPDVLRSGQAATDDRQQKVPPPELVFACMCDDHTHASVTYWGHPPDKPEIKVISLDELREAKANRPVAGLVSRGIPDAVREAVAAAASIATKFTYSRTESGDS
jgi:hypothetical protein